MLEEEKLKHDEFTIHNPKFDNIKYISNNQFDEYNLLNDYNNQLVTFQNNNNNYP